jgi:NADH:ubiquinone oxidoreductase subunit D
VLTAEEAINYSMAGPMLRASGVNYDLRKIAPYSIYDRFDFDVCTGRRAMSGRGSVSAWTRFTRACAS